MSPKEAWTEFLLRAPTTVKANLRELDMPLEIVDETARLFASEVYDWLIAYFDPSRVRRRFNKIYLDGVMIFSAYPKEDILYIEQNLEFIKKRFYDKYNKHVQNTESHRELTSFSRDISTPLNWRSYLDKAPDFISNNTRKMKAPEEYITEVRMKIEMISEFYDWLSLVFPSDMIKYDPCYFLLDGRKVFEIKRAGDYLTIYTDLKFIEEKFHEIIKNGSWW